MSVLSIASCIRLYRFAFCYATLIRKKRGEENRQFYVSTYKYFPNNLVVKNTKKFHKNEYISIHKKLFIGIYNHAGKIRDYNITKKEWVLDGATVLYGSASELRETLDYDFSEEKNELHNRSMHISGQFVQSAIIALWKK